MTSRFMDDNDSVSGQVVIHVADATNTSRLLAVPCAVCGGRGPHLGASGHPYTLPSSSAAARAPMGAEPVKLSKDKLPPNASKASIAKMQADAHEVIVRLASGTAAQFRAEETTAKIIKTKAEPPAA